MQKKVWANRIYIEYSNVFVKYVFYFTSEIKNIFNKKHLNFLFIIYIFPIIFLGKEKRIFLYISLCFVFLVVADEFIKSSFFY